METPGSSTSRQAGSPRPDRNDIVIVAGFQGVAQDTKDVTTLGRGASDTTAVALAASLGADHCEIYTDVDGVYTDPRIVPSARRIPEISYEEMMEMAAWRQDLASTVRNMRAARTCSACAFLILRQGRYLAARAEGRKRYGASDHFRGRP